MKLHPDAQFHPTAEAVTEILSAFGLTSLSFTQATSGIENCTLIVETASDKYVLRIYRQNKKTAADVQLEADFVDYLHKYGIPVAPLVLTTDGKRAVQWHGQGKIWQAVLMRHMPGAPIKDYSAEWITGLAKIQARMHLLADEYSAKDRKVTAITELREAQFIKLVQDRQDLSRDVQGFLDRAEAYVVRLDSTLPSGLCHLDYDIGNVLGQDGIVTAVLDFDDIAYAPYVMCLAYTLWDIAFDTDASSVKRYLADYEPIRPLSGLERTYINRIMLFRHYMIGSLHVLSGKLDDRTVNKYLAIEEKLLSDDYPASG